MFASDSISIRDSECFDQLSMNVIFLIISNFSPFVLGSSKDSEGVFQGPAD
jgi:hypothetical protein